MTPLIEEWKASDTPPDTKEICRRLIDLFLVSVLLDAGAGNSWQYVEPESGQTFSRSEGLGVASINMFEQGFFSSHPNNPHQVDGSTSFIVIYFVHSSLFDSAEGLARITAERTASAMQVTASNPMVGIEGRSSLLQNLSGALKSSPGFFGADARPGNLVGKPNVPLTFSPIPDERQIFWSQSPSSRETQGVSPLPPCGLVLSKASPLSGPRHVRRWVVSHSEMCGLATRSSHTLLLKAMSSCLSTSSPAGLHIAC